MTPETAARRRLVLSVLRDDGSRDADAVLKFAGDDDGVFATFASRPSQILIASAALPLRRTGAVNERSLAPSRRQPGDRRFAFADSSLTAE